MKNLSIDINADLGEGIGNEIELMPYLSSCSIACGGHTGDFNSMRQVVKLAKQHQVKIGAHPSFPDTNNFGRLVVDMSSEDLFTSLKAQIEDILKVLNEYDLPLHHVKPHGALYNLAAKDKNTASVIIDVIKSINLPIKLYAPYKSVIAELAIAENIDVIFEGFADRNYNDDLSLVSRQNPNALITNSEEVFRHVFRMISKQKVMTIGRVEVPLKVATICVHGDTPNAVELVSKIHQKLLNKNIAIE